MSDPRCSLKLKLVRTIGVAILASLACSGCLLLELNAGHYQAYFHGGLSALDAEDFSTAKKRFARACYYGQDLGPEAEAAAVYNYGLAVGQLGEFVKAESCFKRALELDAKTEGKEGRHASMRWFELARLYQAWGKDELSRESYEKAFPLAEEQHASGNDPISVAMALDDYAGVLDSLGLGADSAKARERAESLRRANPDKKALVKILHYPPPTMPKQ